MCCDNTLSCTFHWRQGRASLQIHTREMNTSGSPFSSKSTLRPVYAWTIRIETLYDNDDDDACPWFPIMVSWCLSVIRYVSQYTDKSELRRHAHFSASWHNMGLLPVDFQTPTSYLWWIIILSIATSTISEINAIFVNRKWYNANWSAKLSHGYTELCIESPTRLATTYL